MSEMIKGLWGVWIKDLITGEETCIVSETCKDVVKNIKKERG